MRSQVTTDLPWRNTQEMRKDFSAFFPECELALGLEEEVTVASPAMESAFVILHRQAILPTIPANPATFEGDFMTIQNRIESLGGLHDATIISLAWSAEDRRLLIEIDDINSNTNGLPEYPGPIRATFVFSEVTLLELKADLAEDGLMVYEWKMSRKGPDRQASSISLTPGGELAIECRSVEITGA
jgi:hypothetical protein